MPRSARATPGGYCFHVLNRGNGQQTVFHRPADYDDFTRLMVDAGARADVAVLTWCLMPNHFHFVVRPAGDDDLARWMQWLMSAQVRRHRARHGSSGHLWQGRYKSFPVQDDSCLYTVVRYVERNPVRAGLVGRAEDWRWSSLPARLGRAVTGPALAPLDLPLRWAAQVNREEPEAELAALRHAIRKGAPYGRPAWVEATARRLGLAATLRGPGRPRRAQKWGHS